ncbi:hypothetical protein ASF61_05480 [Duganella sp. Leaf126]|uniref:hypothetical protein n=1 Tax=Duganella sp. Leaf126 TaxID=1736266 RepID=UPI0006F42074|nr:hypothetical protein [Duganella sp. Leaf126]KQQ40231.1 hypothetical protein ASF61_05480 [Duganella sp. Leaf126]
MTEQDNRETGSQNRRNVHTAHYVPLATARTKDVVKHLQVPGERHKIDVARIGNRHQRAEVDAWLVAEADGPVHFFYQDGVDGHEVEFGFADEVREAIDEAETES